MILFVSGTDTGIGKTVLSAALCRDAQGQGRVVLATLPSLGTLNHTALSIEALEHRGQPLEGLVLCGWPVHPGLTERSNRQALAAMAPLLGYLPYLAELDTEHPGQAELPALLEFKD